MTNMTGFHVKCQTAGNNVLMFITLSPGHAGAKTISKTLWDCVGIATTKFTLEQN